jgi:hypothetical protein
MAEHRPQPGLTLEVTWFQPSRGGTPRLPVSDLAALRRLLTPYRDHERLVLCLDRDEGESGSVWVHLTGDRAWVTHFAQLGGVDSYCRDKGYRGEELVGFLLDNGQLDQIHRYWTVARGEGFRALEYFLKHGQRDPSLSWVQGPKSLQAPA